MPVLTCGGNLEARVFGYMNGASLSAKIRSSGSSLFSSSFRTPLSDLSYGERDENVVNDDHFRVCPIVCKNSKYVRLDKCMGK